MPLDELYPTFAEGHPVRIAESGTRIPNVELKFVTDEYDRLSLSDTIVARFDSETLRIASLEIQIAYKLGTSAERDFEDATHIFEMARGTLNSDKLERYVERLGLEDAYAKLRE